MKTFYSLEDIESLVSQGVRELLVDEDTVLTDVAREAAARMGLKLAARGQARPAAAAAAPVLPAAGGVAKPRGCQHGPLTGPAPAAQPRGAASPAKPAAASGALVDDLVGAVKKMAAGQPTAG
jgi:hypothetical protein